MENKWGDFGYDASLEGQKGSLFLLYPSQAVIHNQLLKQVLISGSVKVAITLETTA